MRIIPRLLVTLAFLLPSAYTLAAEDAALTHARELLRNTILIDGHNDLPWAIREDKKAPGDVAAYDLRQKTTGQTDIARLREGGVGGQFWSVYVPGEGNDNAVRIQLEQIDIARRMIAQYPGAFQLALTAKDVRDAHAAGKIASLIGMEGGHAIADSLGALRAYYDLGVRYMTLTHNVNTSWADSAAQTPPQSGGLSPFGEQVVHEMNRIGMLVDLSHVSVDTMHDALRVSEAPVIFSHSSSKALCDVPRNVPDDVLRELKTNGGVIMVAFVAGFIDPRVAEVTAPAMAEYNLRSRSLNTDAERKLLEEEIYGKLKIPPTSIAKVADHFDHIRDVAGVDHIGIGADFDGNDKWPVGLSDVSMYPNLFAELIRRGWPDAELKKIAGENVLRALEGAEAVSTKLRQAQK